MSSRKIEDLAWELQPLCREWLARCEAEGVEVLITCTYRDQAEQDALYAKGRTAPGAKVTWTRKSRHTQRTAWDFAVMADPKTITWDPSAYEKPGAIAESLGLVWGGRWKTPDRPHIEQKEVA